MFCEYVAKYGQLEIFKWLHTKGYGINKQINQDKCLNAINEGRMKIVEKFRENTYPWDKASCTEITKHDYVGIIKYMRQIDKI